MSACRIDGNTVKQGLDTLVKKQIDNSNLFTRDGDTLVSKGSYFEPQEFVKGINERFSAEVIKRVTDNQYVISIPDSLTKDYVYSTQEGKEVKRIIGLYNSFEISPDSLNSGEMFTALNYPEITEMTNDVLKSFLKSLNPNFRIEEIDDLSVEGVAYVKDFLIKVRTLSKFKAMPEEVSHVFLELLPDDNPLKKDMLDNITSFPIYELTRRAYENKYLTEDGRPDYDKIKREAAAKLLAEFITAHSTNDNSRIEALTKTKQNFITKWFGRFLEWLGLGIRNNTQSYIDTVGIMLSGKNDQTLKTDKEIADISFTDSYFYRATDEELYKNAVAIIEKKPPRLLEIMTNFSKEFGRKFNEVLKDEKYAQLNEELKKTGDTIGKINRLTEIKALLGEASIELDAALESDSVTIGIKQFLEAVDRLDILSEALLKIVTNKDKVKEFDKAIDNIRELETYFSLYETFKNIISVDLADTLVQSNVGAEVVESILRTQTNFDTLNRYIIDKQKDNLFVFFKDMMSDANKNAMDTLNKELEVANKIGNPDIIKSVQDRIKNLIITDDNIVKMLSGKGKDIDGLSNINHLINAAILNGDMYLSSIVKYIQSKMNVAHNKAQVEVRTLYQKIDPLVKALGESAEVTGAKTSFIDKVYDRDLGKIRDVLTWLNPHKDIQPVLDEYKRNINEKLQKRMDTDRNSPEFKIADDEYKKTMEDYRNFLEKYYNRPFVKEYYDFRKRFETNTDFINAMGKWKDFTDKILSAEEYLKVEPENDEVWQSLAFLIRERSNLLNEYDLRGDQKTAEEIREVNILKQYFDESSLFKEEDEVQTERTYLISKNRYEQKLDFAIQNIRTNPKIKTIEEAEEKLRELLHDNRLRIVTVYVGEADDPDGSIDFEVIKDILMDRWYNKNIIIQKNEKYYEDQEAIYKKLEELQNKGELTELDIKIKDVYEEIRRLTHGSRDAAGEINPDALIERDGNIIDTSVIDRILELEEELEDLKKQRPKVKADPNDMSPEHKAKYDAYGEELNDPNTSSSRRRYAISQRNKLLAQYSNQGKAKEIKDLIKELGSLQDKVPTQYYWDRMTSLIHYLAEFNKAAQASPAISDLERESISELYRLFMVAVDVQDWEALDFDIMTKNVFIDFVEWLKDNKPSLYQWFTDNHTEKSVYDSANESYVKLPYVRSSIYSVGLPVRDEHKKILYNKKYRKSRVKDEYRTGYNPQTGKVELKVGVHITNRETSNGFPEFLPLLPEQGEPADSPYRNEAYYALKNSTNEQDRLRFKYMEILKEAHLANQENLPANLRTWMAVPVIGLTNFEDKMNTPAKLKELGAKAKGFFKKNEQDDALAQAEGMDTVQDIDQFTQTAINGRMPKLGMSQKLDINLVSRNLLRAVEQHTIRTFEFNARVEAAPVVKALVRVMGVAEKNEDAKAFREGTNKERLRIFEKIYSQMILQEVPDGAINSQKVRRVAKLITANTALRMLADPIGGIINYGSAMVNNIIEASAGKYISLNDLAKGKLLAFSVNTSLVADFAKKADLSYNTLLFQTFDFLQGEWEEDLLDRSSSKDKATSVQQMLMIPRKAGELFAQTAVGMGILERIKVKNDIDGKEYPAHELYEVHENNLRLKQGFPEEWNPIDGKSFQKAKNLINRVNLELHGNYAKINQTEASRYALGKLGENMKRWFMPAFQRRFGRESIDIIFEEINEGYYTTSARAAANVFKYAFTFDFGGAKDWMSFYAKSPRHKENLVRMGAELAQATLILLVFTVLLGYSGDDKNKKLDSNSWPQNTAILIMLRVFSETTAYIPVPPLGFQEMKRNALSPFSLPADAISNFAAIAQLGLYQVLYWFGADSLKDELYYQKDSGFWYSEKGDSKLIKYLLKTAGHTGYTLEPAQYIKTFDNLQKRLK